MAETIRLRPPSEEDAERFWRWRTDPRTLRYWFDPRVFSLAEHRVWMSRVLADPQDHLLLGCVEDRPVGVLRLSTAPWEGRLYGEAGIYVDPELHGRGLGTKLLRELLLWRRERVPELAGLCARVDAANAGSRRIFEKSGFSLLAPRFWGGLSVPAFIAAAAAHARTGRAPDPPPAGCAAGYVGYFLEPSA